MRPLVYLILPVLLSACAGQPVHDNGQPADQERIYSYVDAQGHLVQGELPAHQQKKPTPLEAGQKDVRSFSYKDAQGHLVTGDLPPAAAGKDANWQTSEQAEAKADALAHDRFVTYYDATGRLIREPVDPVTARAHRKEQEAQQHYQQIAVQAAQQSRARQYVETMTAIPADCCTHLLAHAEKLTLDTQRSLTFANGSYGWLQLAQAHPAHIYSLGAKAKRLFIKSYKQRGNYLHPYLLFLDASGTPLLAVNNLFQRRYPETWYRYGYVEGSVLTPAKAAYVVVYLSYETGSRELGMVPQADPTLVPEPDATPAGQGQLTFAVAPD